MTSGEIYCQVVARISEVTPPGLGHWDRAWKLVEEPSAALRDAVQAWEREDTSETRDQVNATAGVLVSAWKDATRLWGAKGRPLERRKTAGVV